MSEIARHQLRITLVHGTWPRGYFPKLVQFKQRVRELVRRRQPWDENLLQSICTRPPAALPCSSDPSSVRIRRNPTTETHKPTLYVLAVGVAKFKNHSHLKLNFADADANAFVERIMKQEHGLYSRVLAQKLVNELARVETMM